MKKKFNFLYLLIFTMPVLANAWQWQDLWQTKDQQGARLLAAGQAEAAAHTFKDKNWQAVASYRSGDYASAYQYFKFKNTSDSQYNAGNAAAFLGHYQDALAAYDKAINLNAKNQDAITNREIIKKLLQEQQQKNQNSTNKEQDKQQQNQAENNQNNNNKNDDKNKNKEDNKDQSKPSNSQQSNSQQQQENDNQQPENKEEAKNKNTQPNLTPQTAQQQDAKDDDKKQMMRRLADDPGGLLRQKFLRDYYQRHTNDSNLSQGDD